MAYKIALGTAQFGLDYGINNKKGRIPKKEVFKILTFAWSRHIRMLDTASVYGKSEAVIGAYLRKHPQKKFQIISKLPPIKTNIDMFINESLLRLNIKKFYAYLFHDFRFFLKNQKIISLLTSAKKNCVIDKIGFSLYYPQELEYLIKNKINFDLVQVPYNLFDRRFEKYFAHLSKRGIEIHVRSAFLQGLFFKKIKDLPVHFLPVKTKLRQLRELAENHQLSLSSLCLNFVCLNQFVDRVIIGVDNLNNLVEDVKILGQLMRVKKINHLLVNFQEDNEKIIIPVNWPKK